MANRLACPIWLKDEGMSGQKKLLRHRQGLHYHFTRGQPKLVTVRNFFITQSEAQRSLRYGEIIQMLFGACCPITCFNVHYSCTDKDDSCSAWHFSRTCMECADCYQASCRCEQNLSRETYTQDFCAPFGYKLSFEVTHSQPTHWWVCQGEIGSCLPGYWRKRQPQLLSAAADQTPQ